MQIIPSWAGTKPHELLFFALSRLRPDECHAQHVGRAGRAQRNAGRHHDALAGLGRAFLVSSGNCQ